MFVFDIWNDIRSFGACKLKSPCFQQETGFMWTL